MKKGFTPPLFRETRRFILPLFNKVGGFTMLELLGAILVISIGVLTAYGVVQTIVTYTIDSSDRLISAYLAKEGVELVRNIRDRNWIAGLNWNQGISQGYREADYDDLSLTSCSSCNGSSNDYNYLRSLRNSSISTYNYTYNYTSGTTSKFKRRISIDPDGTDNKIKIIVDVFWSKRGQTHSVKVQENIYDWR